MTDAIDHDRILREIGEEVRARRAAGDFPPDMERELDIVFARLAPSGGDGGFAGFLDAAERLAFVDIEVPTESNLRGMAPVKRGLRTLMAWYVRYVAQQVSAFATSSVTAMRLLGDRVTALEAASRAANRRVVDEGRHVGPTVDPTPFVELVAAHLAGAEGRVLVGECGDGTLLRRLVDADHDAYGLDPAGAVGLELGAGLDIRHEDVVGHLRELADGVLGGVVLLGAPDRLPLGAQIELADRVADVLADGGHLALVAATPSGWAQGVEPVEADLAPGRPLHPDTWVHLLGERGFTGIECTDGPRPDDGDNDDVSCDLPPALAARLARLEAAVLGPVSGAVTATRTRHRPT